MFSVISQFMQITCQYHFPSTPFYHLVSLTLSSSNPVTLTSKIMQLIVPWIDNRISAIELIIPPKTPGPPPHWHEMHDETFLVTKGTVRFHVPEAPGLEPKIIDAKEGDYVVVPTRAPHTFSNETDEEARFFNTFTPVSRDSDSVRKGDLMSWMLMGFAGFLYSLF